MITYDLTQLNLPIGTHIIQVKAKAAGYEDSDFSNSVEYNNAPNLITSDGKYLKDSQGVYLSVLDPANI